MTVTPKEKLFTVLMCINNFNPNVSDAINSILTQTYRNFDFLIIANNCSDSLWDYLKSFEDERILLHRTKIGQLAFNLNYGINLAKSSYVVRMDADDVSAPGRLQMTKDIIISNNYPDIIAGAARLIDEASVVINTNISPSSSSLKCLWYKSPFIHPATALRVDTLIELRGYLGGFQSEDYDLWLRMARVKKLKIITTNEIYLDYRVSPNQSRGHVLSYSEVTGHLFREAVYNNSLKYLCGALLSIIKRYVKVKKYN